MHEVTYSKVAGRYGWLSAADCSCGWSVQSKEKEDTNKQVQYHLKINVKES